MNLKYIISMLFFSSILQASDNHIGITLRPNNNLDREKNHSFFYYDGPNDFCVNQNGFDWITKNMFLAPHPSPSLIFNDNTLPFENNQSYCSILSSFFNDEKHNLPNDFGITDGSAITRINYLKSDIEGFLAERGIRLCNQNSRQFHIARYQDAFYICINKVPIYIDQEVYNKILEYNQQVENEAQQTCNEYNNDIDNFIIRRIEETEKKIAQIDNSLNRKIRMVGKIVRPFKKRIDEYNQEISTLSSDTEANKRKINYRKKIIENIQQELAKHQPIIHKN